METSQDADLQDPVRDDVLPRGPRVRGCPSHETYGFSTETSRRLEESGKFCTDSSCRSTALETPRGALPTRDRRGEDPKGSRGYKKTRRAGGIAKPELWCGGTHVVGTFLNEMVTDPQESTAPGLGHGLIESLIHYGTDAQRHLPHQAHHGEWTGTMCLTEPQCGTDLGLIRTKVVQGDQLRHGHEDLITFGEHDFTDNILHLVLAKLPDAPRHQGHQPSSSRRSTTMGPVTGSSAAGSSTDGDPRLAHLRYEPRGRQGYLVGEPHKGMRAMFVMMNSARLGVGLEGVALGEIAYQTAVEYAKSQAEPAPRPPKRRGAGRLHPGPPRRAPDAGQHPRDHRALARSDDLIANLDVSHHHEDEAVRPSSRS